MNSSQNYDQEVAFEIPRRGLDYDPIIKEMSDPSICESTRVLDYDQNKPAPFDWIE